MHERDRFIEAGIEAGLGAGIGAGLLVAVLLITGVGGAAAEPPVVSEQEAAAAKAVINGAVEALGGEAFTGQRSQIVRGKGLIILPGVARAQPVLAYGGWDLFPDHSRSELHLPTGAMVQTFDGETGWVDFMGQLQEQSAQLRENRQYGINVLRRLGGGGFVVRPLPDAEERSVPCKVVEITDAEGHVNRFFFAADTLLPFKVAYELRGQSVYRLYGDYRLVDGVRVPRRIITFQDGIRISEIEIEEVEINPQIASELFGPPEG